MTTFLRIMAGKDNARSLLESCAARRANEKDKRLFEVAPQCFSSVPGAPFAYWISDDVRQTFEQFPQFESETRFVRQGGVTGDDDRYVRLWWETGKQHSVHDDWSWVPFAKGGTASRWYGDIPVNVVWDFNRGTFGGFTGLLHRPSEKPSSADHYFKGGLTWPLRAAHFSPIPLPFGAVFSIRGYAILAEFEELMVIAAICNSKAFDYLFKVSLGRFGFPEFVVGILQKLPLPNVNNDLRRKLSSSVKRAWSLKRKLNTVDETSHAFYLPAALRVRLGVYDPAAIEAELAEIQTDIDTIAFDLYGFSDADRAAALASFGSAAEEPSERTEAADDSEDEDSATAIDQMDGLLSWSVGVVFGRFDWRLATGERAAPSEPEPFDPLPAKSPGMLPDDAEPFHTRSGILVDEPGIRTTLLA